MTVSSPPPTSARSGPARATRPRPEGFQRALQRALHRAEQVAGARPLASHRRPPLRAPSEGQDELWPARAAEPAIASSVPPSASAPPGVPELQAAVRAAPPAIVAAMSGAGGGPAQLSLGFGAALTVDLRAGAQGLELSLRPAPSLDRAARAELPRLVEALRARGLRVARADVKPRSPARAR